MLGCRVVAFVWRSGLCAVFDVVTGVLCSGWCVVLWRLVSGVVVAGVCMVI